MDITTRVYPMGKIRLLFDQTMHTPGESGNVHQLTTCVAVRRNVGERPKPQRFPEDVVRLLSKPLTS